MKYLNSEMKFVHYSLIVIDRLDNRSYEQVKTRKPKGLWFSVEGKNLGYNWKDFCEVEEFQTERLRYRHQILFNKKANILHLKTADEVIEFSRKYCDKHHILTEELDSHNLDWVRVKDTYQGIIISPYQEFCRYSVDSEWYYGWDCSSGCVWDLECIEEFQLINIPVEIQKYYEMVLTCEERMLIADVKNRSLFYPKKEQPLPLLEKN